MILTLVSIDDRSLFTVINAFEILIKNVDLLTVIVQTEQSAVLSISFEVDIPTGKVGSSLLFERQRRKLPRGVWGHAPPENFEI